MQGGLKVKRSLFSLAIACLAVAAAVPASAQINTSSLPEGKGPFGPFNLAEAYPCTVGTFPDNLGLTPQQTFTGICPAQAGPTGAAPGILCLKRPTDSNGVPTSFALDVNCFAVIPSGQTGPCFVQAYRLFKFVPGSFKCPDVYGLPHFDTASPPNLLPYMYIQFGTGIRTWWSLNFTQPGTRFLLQVVSACQGPAIPGTNPVQHTTQIHVDSWRWRVVADENTLLNVINLFHTGAVSTLEIPCILGEDMYDALVKAQGTLKAAIGESTMVDPTPDADDVNGIDVTPDADDVTNSKRLTDIGDAIFNMEALIVANCLFVEVLNPLVAYQGPAQFGAPNIQPPGNLAQTVTFGTQGSAVAGIIDTIEHPCCCKLLVDLEWISIKNGLVGQTPTLPTF
jgi:hypothetical protein